MNITMVVRPRPVFKERWLALRNHETHLFSAVGSAAIICNQKSSASVAGQTVNRLYAQCTYLVGWR